MRQTARLAAAANGGPLPAGAVIEG